jgi:hypothetical protein
MVGTILVMEHPGLRKKRMFRKYSGPGNDFSAQERLPSALIIGSGLGTAGVQSGIVGGRGAIE